ncbi:MAG: M56 family metallopeptidase [Acidobacteria bacterium]|nr:M56 family metallopeptidase [Acidobacteriota bacterium]
MPSLCQPVTFGVARPVVLLPETLRMKSLGVRRAVLAHELWHVRRRDWLWSLSEEILRAMLWFHPAIWYLVSRVQSSREEVVDELAILSTNARRSYLEALLAFADEPAVYPAARPSSDADSCSIACCSFQGRPEMSRCRRRSATFGPSIRRRRSAPASREW